MSTQDEINEAEWRNPINWTQRTGLAAPYFSVKDTRAFVPKRVRWMGWTINLAQPGGVFMLFAIVAALCAIGFALGIAVSH